jgi:hypothetical protein
MTLDDLVKALKAVASILDGCSKLWGLFSKKGKSKPKTDTENINSE